MVVFGVGWEGAVFSFLFLFVAHVFTVEVGGGVAHAPSINKSSSSSLFFIVALSLAVSS